MNRWINYQQLKYFRTIANEGSILAASQRLGIGQPTLSIQLKQLEETMGVTLFERQHKKLILTDEGNIVLKYANRIFSIGDELLSILNNDFELPKKQFQFGVLDTIPKHTTLSAFEMMQAIEHCSLSFSEGSGDALIKELALGNLDLIISNYIPSPKKGENIYHKKISHQKVVIAGTEKFLELVKKFPKSLDDAPMILPSKPNKLRNEIDIFFNAKKIKYDLVAETQDMSLQKLLALQGSGLIIAPEIAIEEYILQGELCLIGELDNIEENFYLLYTEKSTRSSQLTDFIKNFKI